MGFFAAPLVTNGLFVVGDYHPTQNTLFALDANANGVATVKWSFKDAKARFIAGAVKAGNAIVAPNADGTMYAFNEAGNLIWKFQANAGFWGTPVASKDTIYVASMDHFLYAVKATDGTQIWKADLGASSLAMPLLADDGNLYVGTLGNQLVSVNASTGTVGWKFAASGQIWAAPVAKDGILYFGDISNKIYALNAKDGTLNWTGDLPGSVVSAPAVVPDGMVFVCETGEIVKVGFKNERSWTSKVTSGKLYSSPVLVGDRLVIPVLGGDNLLVTYDLSGNAGWIDATPK
jgi:outer membrane protein assembly factor BamB